MNRKLKTQELGRIDVAAFKSSAKIPLVVVLDNIRSLNNIGSVFRTADAFLVQAIHLCGITAQPPHREIQKTALGATESVDWEHFPTTSESIEQLKADGYQILAIEQAEQTVMLNEFQTTSKGKYAVVFGNEVSGVDQAIIDVADACLEIPQHGTKHSLNISVCAGVVLWEMFNKLH
jgi:23S rRNA (guanosine2251-2'-O)-methyltransferase